MKNTLGDLNNHLFAQLEKLGDDDLTGEELESELKRTDAICDISEQIIKNGELVLCQEKVQVKHELFTSIICLMPHLFPFVLVLSNISFRSH